MRNPTELHRLLLGTEPAPEQNRLYQSGRRGFSNEGEDILQTEAVLIVALAGTFPETPEEQFPRERVLVLTPSGREVWVFQQTRALVKKALGSIASLTEKTAPVEHLRVVLKHHLEFLYVAQRAVLPLEPPPSHWVASGFTQNGVPGWLKKELLSS